jgi:hypothetical protein
MIEYIEGSIEAPSVDDDDYDDDDDRLLLLD